jgi:ubiquitin-activating enzyme E1
LFVIVRWWFCAALCSAKSTIASEAAQRLNPRLHINPLQNRVSPETENVFNDAYWEGLDLVVNALDNVNARLYVDSRYVGDNGQGTAA